MRRIALILVLGMAVMPAASQTPPVQKPAFEVTSVKRNTSGVNGGTTVGSRGNGYYAPNVTLRILIHSAYADPRGLLLPNQIVGGPDWMDTDRFDVQARMQGDSAAIPPRQRQLMLQSLLEDRFQLKAHLEMRDWPVYNLVVAKGGPKMKLSEDQTPPTQTSTSFDSGQRGEALPRGFMKLSTGLSTTVITGNSVTVARLVSLLQGQADRIVIDRTDLKGLFDVNLQFSRQSGPSGLSADVAAPVDPSEPSLFTAMQELGLRLEAAKTPMEVVVIDSVQKPSEN